MDEKMTVGETSDRKGGTWSFDSAHLDASSNLVHHQSSQHLGLHILKNILGVSDCYTFKWTLKSTVNSH